MNAVDLNFVTDGTLERIAARRNHVEELRREFFRERLKMIATDTEQAVDYCRDLILSGADTSEELTELETTARGLLLVALLLKREQGAE